MTQPPPRPSASKTWLRAIQGAADLTANSGRVLADVIEERAETLGDAPALLSDAETLSYAALAARSRRYSRWGLSLGLARGDGVALLMGNRPDYIAAWTGLSRIGVVVALLNTHLRGAALAHCIGATEPPHIIVEDALAEALDGARPHLTLQPQAWAASPTLDLSSFDDGPFAPGEFEAATQADTALHIFTSGTTGLPKAARISHARIMSWSGWFAGLLDVTPDDRLYDCLPLYHSVGGVTAIGAALAGGGSVVVAERFSAGRIWSDVVRWDCTLFQYIGELCRYLLATPPGPDEARHRLRLMCGNGLRADVWTSFQARFAVPEIVEFYAARGRRGGHEGRGLARLRRGPLRQLLAGCPMKPPMRIETQAIHAGFDGDPATGAAAVPIYQTAAFLFDSADHGAALFDLEVEGFRYSRIANPTVSILEERVAAMEGGVAALAVASGQAAL